MPARLRVDSLRAAMEQATGQTATVTERTGYVRIAVLAPTEPPAYRALLEVLRSVQGHWGSSDGTGEGARVWVDVAAGAKQ
ncbi:hypothetical protein [Streptomyces sp. NBC_00199]|uniref:hypothetical protein n=1 Tax=Streptomyces sp. NBC_00199 TaxID=2975678 RepID=UPI002256B7C9|nr:hypothetical protein [Streptomyces sp. NBC_00199]MCX5266101.1 hypothetical protein [Streptomyces sp. NBC_00199]